MSAHEYKLKFTLKAREDLDEIYFYIARKLRALGAASGLIDKIEGSLSNLKYYPLSCSLVADETLKSKNYRKLIVENYLVFYIADEREKNVIVMRIMFGAMNYCEVI